MIVANGVLPYIGETADLALSNREKVRDLETRWNAWNAQQVEPMWR